MITFKYDDKGNLIAYKDGKRVGEVITMGDNTSDNNEEDDKRGSEKQRR